MGDRFYLDFGQYKSTVPKPLATKSNFTRFSILVAS